MSRSVTVTVNGPMLVFVADRTAVDSGETVNLSWESARATENGSTAATTAPSTMKNPRRNAASR